MVIMNAGLQWIYIYIYMNRSKEEVRMHLRVLMKKEEKDGS